MNRIITGALAAIVAALGLGLFIEYRAARHYQTKAVHLESTVRQYAEVIEKQEAARKRAVASLTTRLRAAEREAAINKESRDALQAALQTDPDWATGPAPAAVVDWLRNPAKD